MRASLLGLKKEDRLAIDALMHRLFDEVGQQIVLIELFGSKARGDDRPESDIDVAVVVSQRDWPLEHRIHTISARVSLEHDVVFNLYVVDQTRWLWMGKIRHPLYRSILAEGVELAPALMAAPLPPL